MKYALAAVGFINEDIEYNKAVLADTLRKCAGRADVVIFGEAFLQGFYGINFIAKHDTTVSISRDDMIIREICSMAKEYTIAVAFGFIEKDGDVFFSSQMTIDKNGQIIDLYRRVSPGWKESFAGKEYCEGDGFHTFHLLGREVAIPVDFHRHSAPYRCSYRLGDGHRLSAHHSAGRHSQCAYHHPEASQRRQQVLSAGYSHVHPGR